MTMYDDLFGEVPYLDTKSPMTTLNAHMSMKVAETQDAFIFETISPFVNDAAGFSISKQELVEAISLLRLKKLGLEKYGGALISDDVFTAAAQEREYAKAYNRGFEDGVEKERSRMMAFLGDYNDDGK